jgi:EAL domain-containing protein (putative c-di-GMP-specific phosphodiesterase class I)
MARVLGMHTVAKRTESAAEQEWLTALGVDFVQSNSMAPPVAIESLSKTSHPPRIPPSGAHANAPRAGVSLASRPREP